MASPSPDKRKNVKLRGLQQLLHPSGSFLRKLDGDADTPFESVEVLSDEEMNDASFMSFDSDRTMSGRSLKILEPTSQNEMDQNTWSMGSPSPFTDSRPLHCEDPLEQISEFCKSKKL